VGVEPREGLGAPGRLRDPLPFPTTAEGAETQRVRLHPLVRELAREEWAQLSADEQTATLTALLAGVQGRVARFQAVNADTYRALAQDEDLIARALRAAVVGHLPLPQVISIIKAWQPNLLARSLLLLSQMSMLQLESARTLGDRAAELDSLRGLGSASGYLGRAEESNRYYRQALALARELGDNTRIIQLLAVVVDRMDRENPSADIEPMYSEANAIAGELGDQLTDWATLNALGIIAYGSGHLEEAKQWYQRALESAQAAGNRLSEAQTLMNLGFLSEQMGDVAAAQKDYEATLAVARAFGTERYYAVGVALNALGQLALQAGDLKAAAHYLTGALPHFEETAGAGIALHVRGNLAILEGLVAQGRGEREVATQAFEEALRLFGEAGNVGGATDQRPFVRQLLAELQAQPAQTVPSSATEPSAN
jgi:tetratricopeptide (TPR) repeat protein